VLYWFLVGFLFVRPVGFDSGGLDDVLAAAALAVTSESRNWVP